MPRFTIDGQTYELLTQDDLTLGELRAVQKVCGGRPLQTLPEGDADGLQAMLWVSMKRRRPQTHFTELDDVPLAGLDLVGDDEEGAGEAVDPSPRDDLEEASPDTAQTTS